MQVTIFIFSIIAGKWQIDLWMQERKNDGAESEHLRYHVMALTVRMAALAIVSVILYYKGLSKYALDVALFVELVGLDAAVIVFSSFARRT